MKEKPGFMIRHKHIAAVLDMPDKDLGALVKLLYYVSIGQEQEPPARLKYIFNLLAADVREDTQHYNDKVEQARRAGKASADARQKGTDVNDRQRTSTSANQYNTMQYNTKQSNNNNNPALNYSQRGDDLKDVMMDM